MKTRIKTLVILFILFTAGPAFAHPHIFINYRADCSYDNDNLTEIVFTLEFDKMGSTTQLDNYDDNEDGKLDEKELAKLLDDFRIMFKENNYYLGMEQAGKPVIFAAPELTKAYFDKKFLKLKLIAKPDFALKGIQDKPLEVFFYDKTNLTAFIPMVDEASKPKVTFAGDIQKYVLATKFTVDPDTFMIQSKKLPKPNYLRKSNKSDLGKNKSSNDSKNLNLSDKKNSPDAEKTSQKNIEDKNSKKADTLKNKSSNAVSAEDFEFKITQKASKAFSFVDFIRNRQRDYNKYCKSKIADIAEAISPLTILIIFFTSVALGFVHAAAPGHGKSIAIAYFSNKHAKFSQPFLFGFTVAGTHTGIALLISFIFYILIKDANAQSNIVNNINFGFGILFFSAGIFLLINAIRASLGKPDHHEEHIKIQPNKNLFRVAIVGGLIPCPLSLMILGFFLTCNLYYVGVIAVLGIAIGTGLLISLAGLLVVLGRKKFLDRLDEESPIRHRFHIAAKYFTAILVLLLASTLFMIYAPPAVLDFVFPTKTNTQNAVNLSRKNITPDSSAKKSMVLPDKKAKPAIDNTNKKIQESEHKVEKNKPIDLDERFRPEDEIL